MKEEDLEKTVPIENLADILNEQLEEENDEENITQEEVIETQEDKKVSKFKAFKNWFGNLSKKNKILVILIPIIILLLVLGIILVIVLSKDEEEIKEEKPQEEEVVVVKDNYIYKDGILSLLNSNGDEIGTYECKNKEEKLCYVAYYSNEDSFDTEKYLYEDNSEVLIRSSIFNDNYVFIFDNKSEEGFIILYDLKNKKEINKVRLVKEVNYEDKKYAIVQNDDGLYGLYEFDDDAKLVIDFEYDYMGYINGNKYLVVKKDNLGSLIDFSNKEVAKGIEGDIKDYNDNYIVTYELKSYKIVNLKNEYVVDGTDDFIKLYDNYYAYVKDGELYYKDYEGNKLYEEGIELILDDYVGTKIFNEEGKKVKDIYSFVGSFNGNNLLVDIYNEDNEGTNYIIDTRDSKVSKDLKFYSYYGNKLYFYEDEEKTILIGSYECTNKNDMSKNSLSTCNVATDTVYEDNYNYYGSRNAMIPIINNRFVFVYDSPTLSNDSNKKINLYNLVTGKILSTYRSVNTHTATNNGVLSHITSANYEVMAQNTSGKYGMISINLTSANGVYDFKYDYMEKLEKGISVKSGSEWSIIYNKDLIVGSYPGRVMNVVNNYVVVKKDNKVYLYNANGNVVVDRAFDYIAIGDKYFGGVDSNKVYVYDLNGLIVNSDGFEINSTDYLTSKNPVFKFSSSNGEDYIDILNSDKSSYSSYALN